MDFPAGGYVACEGRNRCRCTVVMVLAREGVTAAAKRKYVRDGEGQFARTPGVPSGVIDALREKGLLRDDGRTIFGHRIPPNIRLAAEDERKAAGIPKASVALAPEERDRAGVVGFGVDAKGRVKRFYSDEYKAKKKRAKFLRVAQVDEAITPAAIETIRSDAQTNDAAAITQLVEATGIRPGSEADTGAKVQAFGATTLTGRDVRIDGARVSLVYIGKGGKEVRQTISDPQTAKMLRLRAQGLGPDDQVFAGANEKGVLKYVKATLGLPGAQTKDLRTRVATMMAFDLAGEIPATVGDAKRRRNEIGDEVAAQLGNTRAMALGEYVNPAVFAGWPGID